MRSNVTDPMEHTPAEWREQAADCRRREQESWERSDSDGFLSQWALTQMASRYELLATVAEQGGTAELCKLADAEGNVLDARQVDTMYGLAWVYDGPDGNAVWFRESEHKNPEVAAARNLAKGHQIIFPRVPVLMGADGHLFEKQTARA